MQKIYTYIQTPGHGYLSVSNKEIQRLNLVDTISSGSYMNLTRTFLEEDRDAGLFLKAKENLNEKYEIKSSYREVRQILPGGFYDANHINNPIKANSIVTNEGRTYVVVEINKKQVVIENDLGLRWGVCINNPYRYLKVKK